MPACEVSKPVVWSQGSRKGMLSCRLPQSSECRLPRSSECRLPRRRHDDIPSLPTIHGTACAALSYMVGATLAVLSRVGFLGRSPLVPVGAGVVMGWVGTLVVALGAVDGRTKGDRKGPHPTSQPLPPLRGRSRFPGMLAKNLPVRAPSPGER